MLNKYRSSETVKVLFICSASIFSLFLGFFTNFWRVADQQWFNDYEHDMESFIIGRMVKSSQDGIFSAGGLTGLGTIDTAPINQYLVYINNFTFRTYTPYNSQMGGQGMLFSILDKLITLAPQVKIRLFYAFTSLLSAMALTSIILWFYFEFGLTVALFVLTSTVLSQWLVVFGRNLWWSIWAFYVPVAVIMHYLRFNHKQLSNQFFTFGIVVFITIFLKCLVNGYEYITSTLVMMVVPYVYYGILKRLNFRKFLMGLFTAGLCSSLAILISFLILFSQIASVTGNFSDGVDHIVRSFEKRTYANSHDFPPEYAAGLESSTTHVLFTYLNGTFLDANNYLPRSNPFVPKFLPKVRYLHLILLFMIMSGILYFLRNRSVAGKEEHNHIALIFTTWFSLLAPFSWFVIFKAHSYIHTHMNYIVWQMPFTFFGFAVCGLVVENLFPNLIRLIKRSTSA